MSHNTNVNRIIARFRPWLYLSAGAWGALINVLSSLLCIFYLNAPLYIAFACGVILNGIFNFWFGQTYLSASNKPSQDVEVSINSFLLIHLILYLLGLIFIELTLRVFNVPVQIGLVLTVMFLSILSLFLGRIWVFVSPFSAAVEYEGLDASFYEDQTNAADVGSFRAWYHGGRFNETEKLVTSLYQAGMVIYDFGCGGSEWNKHKLPVVGIDINEGMLQQGKARDQLSSYVVADLEDTKLPTHSADIAIITEVLEHMLNEREVLSEIHRVLKPEGHLVLTVPWDTIFSPFFWLFNAQCFYRGYILGEIYYQQRCGHVHHFSKARLAQLLSEMGFEVLKIYRFRKLLLYSVSRHSKQVI